MFARIVLTVLTLMVGGLVLVGHAAAQDDGEFGVYVRHVESASVTFEEVAQTLREGLEMGGWEIVVEHNVAVDPEKCTFRSRVFVVHSPAHIDMVMAHGSHGAFAIPLRLAVYEDEGGVHVGAVNPQNLHRTIVMEEGFDADWAELSRALESTVHQAFPDSDGPEQYGRIRDKGRIGRTMGIMAGGPFLGKIKIVTAVPASEVESVSALAQRLFTALESADEGKDWGTRPVYLLDLPEQDVAVVGVSGARMEARAFEIVGKGSDKSREDMACPGIDHSPAFPVELVVAREGDEIRVLIVDEMYRMKMFFEDAGRMKFARNMTMPGSIEDEIKDMVRAALF